MNASYVKILGTIFTFWGFLWIFTDLQFNEISILGVGLLSIGHASYRYLKSKGEL